MLHSYIMKTMILLIAMALSSQAQTSVEQKVLRSVQELMAENQGGVTFSELHNDSRFGAEEKAFLGRLYEIFFQIPGHLKTEFGNSGRLLSRQQLSSNFNVSLASIELLLRVMEMDRRVPSLFERDPDTREISSLDLVNIEAFVNARGDQVKITQWEGQPLPSFNLDSFEGKRFSSSQLDGHASLLYFWFSGCPPCVRIAPILAELEKEYRSSGLKVVGLNADRILDIETSPEQRDNYLQKNGTEYLNLHVDAATRDAFGNINLYPTLFFVGANGTIVRHLLNFQDRETLEGAIRETLELGN